MNETKRKPDKRIPRARTLRRDATDAERKLWQYLRQLPIEGSHFRRQATIGPYYADFACHRSKIVIELDGGQHADAEQSAHDMRRTVYLESAEYRVLRFWNNDVLTNMEGVTSVITSAIEDASTPPTPDPSPPLASLAGGGEPKQRRQRKLRRDGAPCSRSNE